LNWSVAVLDWLLRAAVTFRSGWCSTKDFSSVSTG
jgi:hypothetical protein